MNTFGCCTRMFHTLGPPKKSYQRIATNHRRFLSPLSLAYRAMHRHTSWQECQMDHVLTKFLPLCTPSSPAEGNTDKLPNCCWTECVWLLQLTRKTLSARSAAELEKHWFSHPAKTGSGQDHHTETDPVKLRGMWLGLFQLVLNPIVPQAVQRCNRRQTALLL